MNRHRGDPFGALDDMEKQMEKWASRVAGTSARPGFPLFRSCAWQPPVDVYETPHEVVVVVDASGLDEQAIQVVLEAQTLVVRGVRAENRQQDERRYYQMEICNGVFERAIELPSPVNADETKASYVNGVLEVRMGRMKESGPTRVTIRTSAPE